MVAYVVGLALATISAVAAASSSMKVEKQACLGFKPVSEVFNDGAT